MTQRHLEVQKWDSGLSVHWREVGLDTAQICTYVYGCEYVPYVCSFMCGCGDQKALSPLAPAVTVLQPLTQQQTQAVGRMSAEP